MKVKVIIMVIYIFFITGYASVAAIPGYSTAKRPVRIYIGNKSVKLKLPVIYSNNRSLYPFRELLENAGAKVWWNSSKKQAEAEYENTCIKFPVNSDIYYINDKKMKMDVKTLADPELQRVYIPVRYAFEALGYTVQWIAGQKHDEIRIYRFKPVKAPDDGEFIKKYFNPDRTSIQYFSPDVENKHIVFRDEYGTVAYKDKILESKINPDINRQVYEVIKLLVSDDQYVRAYYLPDSGSVKNSSVSVVFAKGITQWAVGATYFNFSFQEKYYHNPKKSWDCKNFSEKAFLTLVLNQLYWGVNDAGSEFFEEKLNNSIIALFGQNTGMEIYKYIYDKYIKERTSEDAGYYYYKGTRDSRTINNIKIDYVLDTAHYFYFSYEDGSR